MACSSVEDNGTTCDGMMHLNHPAAIQKATSKSRSAWTTQSVACKTRTGGAIGPDYIRDVKSGFLSDRRLLLSIADVAEIPLEEIIQKRTDNGYQAELQHFVPTGDDRRFNDVRC